ncbi:MAG TPA: hypothetical protein EYP73_00010 [Acidimicrobiia bacterium]|nr:hypothetical protein [Acidimicrobiia bacterium]
MLRALLVVFALVVVACGGPPDTAATTTVSNRPQAPDFTLELGDGGEFTLSAGTKPVYMIFWAEW